MKQLNDTVNDWLTVCLIKLKLELETFNTQYFSWLLVAPPVCCSNWLGNVNSMSKVNELAAVSQIKLSTTHTHARRHIHLAESKFKQTKSKVKTASIPLPGYQEQIWNFKNVYKFVWIVRQCNEMELQSKHPNRKLSTQQHLPIDAHIHIHAYVWHLKWYLCFE